MAPALALGAVHFYPVVVIAAGAFLAAGYLCWRSQVYVMPAALCLALAGYCLLQAAPLPLGLLAALSPESAEVWTETFLLTDGRPPSAASLSIDPGASLREALKWVFYAAVLLFASRLYRRHALAGVLGVVFIAASVLAIVTLAHGLLGAESVYGFYERSFDGGEWALSPLINRNNLAGYLNLGFFSGLALFIERQSPRERSCLAASMALMAALSITSGSRGAAGSLLIGSVICGLLYLRSHEGRQSGRFNVAALFFIILLTAVAFVFLVPEPVLRAWGEKNIDKVHMVRWVAPLIKDHPWFGVGAGAFETGFLPYRVKDDGVIWTHPENFLVGWVTEFGLPITALLLGAFILACARARRTHLRPARVVAWVGVGIWFFHNLFDLAIAVPGAFTAVVALLGGLLEPSRKESPAHSPRASAARWFPGLVSVAGLLTAALALKYGAIDTHSERARLHQALVRGTDSDAARKAFFTDLAAAVKRHPGDAYLFRLGAIAAANEPEKSSLRWLGRALQRDIMSADAHFFLAQDLVRRGALTQALLSLRLAVERGPQLAPTAAAEAVRWTQDLQLLRRAIPDGMPGASMAVALAQALPKTHTTSREALLALATVNDPESPDARLLLVETLLALHQSDAAACLQRTPPCTRVIESELAALAQLAPLDEQAALKHVLLSARFWAQSEQPERALGHLLSECPRDEPACLRQAVILSSQYGLDLREPAKAYLAIACPSDEACLDAHRLLGSAYSKQNLWGKALDHSREVAQLGGTARDYLAAARAAQNLGLRPEALQHLRSLRQAIPPPTKAELSQAASLEQQLNKDSRNKLLRDLTQPE